MIEDLLKHCIVTGQTIDIDFEFTDSLHMYEGVTVKGLTDDGYVVIHVPYIDPEDSTLVTLEVFVCINHIVKVSRIVAKLNDSKVVYGDGKEDSK